MMSVSVYSDYQCVHLSSQAGDSALMKAARWGKTEVVVKLVEAGANLNLQNKVQRLSKLCMDGIYFSGFIVSCDCMWPSNSKCVHKCIINDDGCVHWKSQERVATVLTVLLLTTQNGDSAVIQATVRHKTGTLSELVSAGADLNFQNQVRYTVTVDTALHHCINTY